MPVGTSAGLTLYERNLSSTHLYNVWHMFVKYCKYNTIVYLKIVKLKSVFKIELFTRITTHLH